MLGKDFVALAREFQEFQEARELRGNAKELKCVPDRCGVDHNLVELAAVHEVRDREQCADFGESRQSRFEK